MTIRSLASLIAATAIAGSTLLAAIPANAETHSVRVGYSDLDLSSAAGQRTLARRVSSAASAVCPSDMGTPMQQGSCRSAAIDRAHADLRTVGVPTL